MTRTFVAGVGTSHFGKQPEKGFEYLAGPAIAEALRDAGITGGDVDAVFCGTVFAPSGTATRILRGAGLAGVPAVAVEAACASGTAALKLAEMSIRSGEYRTVLVLGVEKMSGLFEGPITPEQSDPEGRAGLAMPAMYGLMAARYLHDSDATVQDLAAVAVKNHHHGTKNPRVDFGGDFSAEEVLRSKPIADPLTLLQCCPQVDGAAAAIITSEPRDRQRSVTLAATVLTSGEPWGSGSGPWSMDTVRRTADAAYERAGIAPEEIDVLEVHDAFSIGELMAVESLGLSDRHSSAELLRSGHTALGGRQPVNPSGGLLSRGHPLGATGLAQLAEAVWQLRGSAGPRQVEAASTALIETMGGGASGVDANACAISVLMS